MSYGLVTEHTHSGFVADSPAVAGGVAVALLGVVSPIARPAPPGAHAASHIPKIAQEIGEVTVRRHTFTFIPRRRRKR